jgi:D-galactarolactone cycloisomerase
MRIERIELRRYSFPLDPPFVAAWDPTPRAAAEATLVFVHTDEGLVGIGSGDTMDGFERWTELFLGRDPLDIEHHVRVLETLAFHAARYWPLEAALWDLAGKAAGRPAAELLGGATKRLPAYASSGEAVSAEDRVERARRVREARFRALKLRIDRDRVEEGLAVVRAVREALGRELELMVDLNQGWRMPGDVRELLDREAVLRLADELAELGIFWLEEPLPTRDLEGLRELRSRVRVAGGEMVRTVDELAACIEHEALDVLQPDAVLAVGVTRAAEVARCAQEAGRWFTPHTWTNGIGLLANLHLSAGVGAEPFLEFPFDPPCWTPERRDWMLAEPVAVDADGFLTVPDLPGLGIVLDEERLEAHRVG